MSLRWLAGAATILATSVATSLAGALVLFSPPRTAIAELELDGRPAQTRTLSTVSPRPQLLITVDRPLDPGYWHIFLDGRPVPLSGVPGASSALDLRLPALALGTRHEVRIAAGQASRVVAFRVVPPLQVELSMRLHDLQADQPASALTTAFFSSPVADRAAAQSSLHVTGAAQATWLDAQTLQVLSTGLALGSAARATLDDGISAKDGSYTRGTRTASLMIPATITQVVPERTVEMYYINTPDGHASLFSHLDQIDMLSPGWYDANADGSITGYAHQDVIDAAHAHHVQIVPLVVNAGVDPDVAHAILSDPGRRATLALNLGHEAKAYGYAGFQLDFEQVRWTDRDLLTALAQDCAAALHAQGLSLSLAVIPRLAGDASSTGALLSYYHTWSGAYDFPALAKVADFLAFMTYDEHNGVTPAGPVSGIPWMRQALEFSLQGVPPEKVTLGLPTYYHDWIGVGNLSSSSYGDALSLASTYGATPAFDPVEDELHFNYDPGDGTHHQLWYESGDTLRRKLPLLYEYGLRGISVWRLGFEDPAFWNVIPSRR